MKFLRFLKRLWDELLSFLICTLVAVVAVGIMWGIGCIAHYWLGMPVTGDGAFTNSPGAEAAALITIAVIILSIVARGLYCTIKYFKDEWDAA